MGNPASERSGSEAVPKLELWKSQSQCHLKEDGKVHPGQSALTIGTGHMQTIHKVIL